VNVVTGEASKTRGQVRVFICDDVAELREITRIALEDEPDLHVVGESGNAAAGIARIEEVRPDVVLLDLSMPGMDGLEAIPLILERSPHSGILVFSGFGAERMGEQCLKLGADMYMEKGESLDRLRAAVREVAAKRREGTS